jgi:hypothetical protein
MIKRIILIATLGTLLSGCFMAPLAFVGPAASGFSTASIVQSGFTSGVNYVVKKNTGKTIGQHAFDAVTNDQHILQQSYFPDYEIRTTSKK